ncbi:MAG: class I SAM-dependent methyltransferase [Phycisphaerae bacterium]|nr:class I SAM-dependent methyltransferase [Phycisphaerae bacterium]
MSHDRVSSSTFLGRFVARDQGLRYRDRYRTGRHARVDRLERAALRELMADLGTLHRVLDLPSGTGRLSAVLAEFADRVTLADGSSTMLQIAREDLNGLPADYIQTDLESLALNAGSVDLVFATGFSITSKTAHCAHACSANSPA